jgi:hypothetical protein
MDQIRPIGPPERDIDPVYRVERAHDESEGREQPQRKRRPQPETQKQTQEDVGPVEGDDGHLHVDIRA